MSSLIAWILRAIPFGTIIMYGALGETLTEKSGNLNLGVPGIMYLGGFAGFASAYYYEKLSANPSAFVCVILALLCALIASALGGLIYAFLTITLRANQNVTGLALTTFGMGVANFFGVFILNGASYTAAPLAYKAFSAMIPVLSGLGVVGEVLFSYGFLAYAAIVLAVVLHWFFTRTRAGLNLRAVGENPQAADAAGISVLLWGIGASLGFPLTISAASDTGPDAPKRVSVVAITGYLAFLVGPPLLGFLGEHFGLRSAMMVVLGLVMRLSGFSLIKLLRYLREELLHRGYRLAPLELL